MTIVFVSAWYSENMGYLENCLPKSLAKLGHQVHVVTSTAQVYFNQPFYAKAYQKYLGDPIQPAGTFQSEGVSIHRLPFSALKSKITLRGLFAKLRAIRPDVVHTFEPAAIDTVRLAVYKLRLGYKLYTANHAVFSVYPVARNWATLPFSKKIEWFLTEYMPGRFVNLFIEKCFAVTIDAGEIATVYRGVSKNKVKVTTLGVDTDAFYPDLTEREQFRAKWGFQKDDIICFYSGKLIAQKQPVLLAQAIDVLAKRGIKIKGFFVAEGELEQSIKQFSSCQVIPLQPFKDLPNFFRMADIAVWPGEESSSQLDAAASGACLVLTDNIKAYDEVDNQSVTENTEGGKIYKPRIVSRKFKHGNLDDLVQKLESLLDENTRSALAQKSVFEIKTKYSWDIIAQNRIADYEGRG